MALAESVLGFALKLPHSYVEQTKCKGEDNSISTKLSLSRSLAHAYSSMCGSRLWSLLAGCWIALSHRFGPARALHRPVPAPLRLPAPNVRRGFVGASSSSDGCHLVQPQLRKAFAPTKWPPGVQLAPGASC